tara:strand:+ start:749 stop:901 length:153 start_codon:yes stop_codon:yes gene_type:complete
MFYAPNLLLYIDEVQPTSSRAFLPLSKVYLFLRTVPALGNNLIHFAKILG